MDASTKFPFEVVQVDKPLNKSISDNECIKVPLSESQNDVCVHPDTDLQSDHFDLIEDVRKDESANSKKKTCASEPSEDTMARSFQEHRDQIVPEENEMSQLTNEIRPDVQNEENIGNELAEEAIIDLVENSDKSVDEQNLLSHLTNTIVRPVSVGKKGCTSVSENLSNSREQHEEPNTRRSDDLLSNTVTDSVTQFEGYKNDVGKSSNFSLSNDSHKKNDNEDTSCTPIILSVRGNATDIDCMTGSSITTDDSIVSSDATISCAVDKNATGFDISSHKENQSSIVSIPGIHNGDSDCENDVVSPDPPAILSSLYNTMPSSTDLHLSTSKKSSASLMQSSVTMPASSLLVSVMSCIAGTTQGLSAQVLSKACGTTLSNTKGMLTSTSGSTSSVTRKLGNNEPSAPISSTVKIVLKGSDNVILAKKVQCDGLPKVITTSGCNKQNKNNNKGVDTELLCKAIVNKIFKNYATEEDIDVMTPDEVFKTNLLDPCKKNREDHDKQFVCSICGDEFYLKEFLNHHFSRKTFELTYYCPECKKNITFFNKCKFWLHVRDERPELTDKELLKNETSCFRLKPIFEPEIEKRCISRFYCKFCDNDFDKSEKRALHIKKSSQYLYTCKNCSLLFANRCALLAHQAIHEAVGKEHVCPQCGDNIDHSDGLRVLFEHLDSCFHFNTRYVMSCECGEMFATVSDFTSHFLKAHTKLLYRCHVCGSCFTSFENFAIHVSRSHSTSLISDQSTGDKIVLCSICKEGFGNHLRLKSHVETHVHRVSEMRKKVLTCFLCQNHFSDPKSLCNHVEKQHIHRPKRCTICFGLFESRQNLVQHIVSKSCSPNKLPTKLHVCLDKPSSSKSVDVGSYKQMFRLPQNVSVSKGNLSTASSKTQSITKVATASSENVSRPTVSPAQSKFGTLSSQKATTVAFSSQKSTTPSIFSPEIAQRTASSVKSVSTIHSSIRMSSKTVTSHCEPFSPNVELSEVSSTDKATVGVSPKRTLTGFSVKPDNKRKKFQCHSCKICLVGENNYNKHRMHHESMGVDPRDNFCSICKKTVNAGLIQSHMEDHQMSGVIVCSLCQSRNFYTMNAAIKHSRNLCYYTIVVNDGAHFIKRKKSQNNNENVEKGDKGLVKENETSSEMQSLNAVPIIQQKATVFPCLMCCLAFTSKQEKEDHVSRFHDGTRTLYFCLVCKRKGVRRCFNKKNLLSKHISRKHRIVNPSQIAKSILMEEQNVASGQVVPSESSDVCNGDTTPPKRLRLADEGAFVCGKCGFSSEDSKLFEDHIVTHNPRKEPQCPECGLCFTVLAALKKHLFVVHKIKAVDEYLEKRKLLDAEEEMDDDDDSDFYGNSPDLSDSSPHSEVETRKVKRKRTSTSNKIMHEFECTVCHRSLSSGAALQKHMRNHGMAFIRSKRLDKI